MNPARSAALEAEASCALCIGSVLLLLPLLLLLLLLPLLLLFLLCSPAISLGFTILLLLPLPLLFLLLRHRCRRWSPPRTQGEFCVCDRQASFQVVTVRLRVMVLDEEVLGENAGEWTGKAEIGTKKNGKQ